MKNLVRIWSRLLTVLLAFAVISACSRDDGIPSSKTVAVNEPDNFARYINQISGLPSGDFTIVVATTGVGESGSFTLTVSYDDGSEEIFEGNWTSSGGMDATSTANPAFDFTQFAAGGITITLESTADNYLYLLRRADGANGSVDRSGPVFAEDDNSFGGTDAQIALATSRIDGEAFGKAYYDTIDPTDAKTTLEDWKTENGYDAALAAGRVINARFRDTKDLGYGRGMRVWTNAQGDFFAFAENFQVRTVEGLEYTDINLDALILDDRQHHFGTNAIEYSTYPYGAGEPSDMGSTHRFTKFFTFDATGADQTQTDHANEIRLDTVNLDGRGLVAMPGACVYCHGGTLRPLRADGTYRDNCYNDSGTETCNGIDGDTNAKLQLLEVDSFAFWPQTPHTQPEEEVFIKQINLAIYCTYPGADATACAQAFCDNPATPANCDGMGNPVPVLPPAPNDGSWSGDFAREMATGWYDDDSNPATVDFGRTSFNGDFVPDGWDPASPNTPVGSNRTNADTLFLEVVQPICFVCHSRRGTDLGTNESSGESKDIDFSTYERFTSHAEQIKSYVFDRGVMPLSLRGFNAFWDTEGRPEILAAALNPHLPADNQIELNAVNKVDKPGAVVADAGPDRRATSPLRLFGANTRFASSYSWSIVSTPVGGENATLTDASTQRPLLTAPADGDYIIRLVAGSDFSSTDQDFVTVTVDSAAATNTNFTDDIKGIFTTVEADGRACTSCHADGNSFVGNNIPVWWTDDPLQPATGTTLYEEVLARIDFSDPENSLLLTKPGGNHHYGRLRPGFEVDNPSNRSNYDLMLNWIMEGARFDATNMREP